MSRYRVLRLSACALLVITGGVAASLRSPGALVGASLLLGLAVLAGAPRTVRASARWLRSVPTPSAAQLGMWSAALTYVTPGFVALEPPPQLSELTDEELCDEWRSSCLALRRRMPPRQMIQIVHERQLYLDEFERRNPRGVQAWLASGAWASSAPLPDHVTDDSADGPVTTWDQFMREHGW